MQFFIIPKLFAVSFCRDSEFRGTKTPPPHVASYKLLLPLFYQSINFSKNIFQQFILAFFSLD